MVLFFPAIKSPSILDIRMVFAYTNTQVHRIMVMCGCLAHR